MEKLSMLYASALFDLALERGNLDKDLAEASFLRETLQDPEIMRVLLHPHISRNDKQKLLTEAFNSSINDDLLGFLNLAIEKNRQNFIISAVEAFIDLIEKHNNIVTAKVITATQLDEKQSTELRELLTEQLKKEIRLSVSVDPSVVAGPYIYVDGYYLDWTFKTRLRELTAYMKEGVVRT